MSFVRTGLFELLTVVVVVALLIAAHSVRLDKALVVVWAILLIGRSTRAVTFSFTRERNSRIAYSGMPPPGLLALR